MPHAQGTSAGRAAATRTRAKGNGRPMKNANGAISINDTAILSVSTILRAALNHAFFKSGNTNGLLRQYFPRGTDLSHFSQANLDKIALRLNQRPRKTLGFETPADRLRAVLQ